MRFYDDLYVGDKAANNINKIIKNIENKKLLYDVYLITTADNPLDNLDIYQANTAFMGIEVPAGSHTVEFRYWLPGLTAGLCVSGVGIVVFVGALVYLKKKKKST